MTFSSPTLAGFTAPATLTFDPLGGALPGLFSIEAFPGGDDFDWEFVGPQIFNTTATKSPWTRRDVLYWLLSGHGGHGFQRQLFLRYE